MPQISRQWLGAAIAAVCVFMAPVAAVHAQGPSVTVTKMVHRMPMRDAKGRFMKKYTVIKTVHTMPMRDAKGRFMKKMIVVKTVHKMPMRDAKGRFMKKM